MRITIALAVTAAAALVVLTGCGGTGTATNPANTTTATSTAGAGPASTGALALTGTEASGLVRLRGEQKVGADAEQVFDHRYGQALFADLAGAQAGQERTMIQMMNRFGVADPMRGSASGSFSDPTLQRMYDMMIRTGSGSAAQALAAMRAYEQQYGQDLTRTAGQTDQDVLRQMYDAMARASANHLAACQDMMHDLTG